MTQQTEHDELIKRLHSADLQCDHREVFSDCRAAADTLDAQAQRIGELEALSVTNIMIDVVPGDGSGLEVYAKSVTDIETKLNSMGEELEDWQLGIKRHYLLQKENDTLRAALAQPTECHDCIPNGGVHQDHCPESAAKPAPSTAGRVLVPLKMTRAMEEVANQDEWSWAELLAAADAVTEEEYEAAQRMEDYAQPQDVNAELVEALNASCHTLHTLPKNEVCKCGQCEFVRLRDTALANAKAAQQKGQS